MAYVDLLINTCTVRRYTTGAADAYGTPTKTWADHLAGIDCRLTTPTGREIKVGAEVVIADFKLFVGDIDITEQDQVVMGGVTYEVLLVADRQDRIGSHHKECYLRTVR